MRFGILGPLQIEDQGERVEVSAPLQRRLLALLLVHANEPLSNDRILDELWGDDQPASGVKTLRFHVSKLRDALGRSARLVTRSPGYVLEVDQDDFDAFEFERLAADGRSVLGENDAAAATTLRQALALWRGPPLSDFAYDNFAVAEANRLSEVHRGILADRIEADLAIGKDVELIPELEILVAENAFDERFGGQLMTALYRVGRQADALRVYRNTRASLGEELGIEPSPSLQELEEQILLQVPELEASAAGRGDIYLPSFVTDFVGRSAELEILMGLLEGNRLVTLAGPGGIGKTRTAVEIAYRAADEYRHGVRMIDLALVAASEAVLQAFADGMDVRAEADRRLEDVLRDHLANKELLLVVDNCEHVLDGVAGLSHRLLVAAGSVSILATSREPLGIPGEVVFRVPALSVDEPAEGGGLPDALLLFVNCIRRWQPGYALDNATLPLALRICDRLDGIPLSIELASARLRVLSLEDLEQHLGERFALLSGGGHAVVARHQSLQAALDWSYELLTDPERKLLRRLSVFRGGFDLGAVEASTMGLFEEPALDLLTRLVDTSLVRAEQSRPVRYGMLETVREYAAAALGDHGEEDDARRRHVAHFADLVSTCAAQVEAGDRAEGFARLRIEEPNIRSALEAAMASGSRQLALEIAADMGEYWFVQGDYDIARRSLENAIAGVESTDSKALFAALKHLTRFAVWGGDSAEAEDLITRQRELAASLGDNQLFARSLASQSVVEWGRGRYRRARDLLVEAIAAIRPEVTPDVIPWLAQASFESSWMGDTGSAQEFVEQLIELRSGDHGPILEASIADARGTIFLQEGTLDDALDCFRQARELYTEMGMGPNIEDMLQSEAAILIELDRSSEAVPLVDQALVLARDLKDARIGARGVLLQGRIALESNDLETARQHLSRALSMSHQAEDLAGAVWAVLCLATLAAKGGEHENVVQLHAIAEGVRRGLDAELPAVVRERASAELADASRRLGERAAAAIWDEALGSDYLGALALSDHTAAIESSPSSSAKSLSSSGAESAGT